MLANVNTPSSPASSLASAIASRPLSSSSTPTSTCLNISVSPPTRSERTLPRVGSAKRHGGQFLHLLLGQVDPDLIVDARGGSDRDRHLLASPQVAPLEQDVRDFVVGPVHHESLD